MPSSQDQLLTILQSEDELGLVVRSHIHIESHLMELVDSFFQSPDYLERMNLGFDQKVSLAQACGLNPQFAAPLRVLNKIRNRFAHDLDSILDCTQVRNLYESFSPGNKEVIQGAFHRTEAEDPEPTGKKFKQLDPRNQFVLIVVAFVGFLEVAIKDARNEPST